MNLNPLTKLKELTEQFIIEHGSSVVQEKHIALLREQLSFSEKQYSALEKANDDLKSDNQNLRDNITSLRKHVDIQKNRADNLQQYINQNKTPFVRPKPIGIIGIK